MSTSPDDTEGLREQIAKALREAIDYELVKGGVHAARELLDSLDDPDTSALVAAALGPVSPVLERQQAEIDAARERALDLKVGVMAALGYAVVRDDADLINVAGKLKAERDRLKAVVDSFDCEHEDGPECPHEAEVERLRAEQAECGLIELIELKGRLAAADEAFKDMAQTNGGVHPADALTHVARIMATLRGAETPHRVAYEQVRKEAWAEVERLEDRLRKAEGAYSMLDAQRLDAEATRDRWKARAEEAEAERDAARLIVEELQALRDSMYGQLDSAVAERDALQAAIECVREVRDQWALASASPDDSRDSRLRMKLYADVVAWLDAALDAPETTTERTDLIGAYATHLHVAGDRADAAEAVIERIHRAIVDVYGEDYDGEDVAAEVERLLAYLSEHGANVRRILQAKNEAIERAQATIDRVRGVHVVNDLGECVDCRASWPCPTIAALDAPTAEETNDA